MTEQDAINHLYDLWQNGEIPNNFDENHSEYYKAIEYTKKNGEFDYENFSANISIIKFGIWQVESDALIAKDGHDYIIECSRFWETSDYHGHLVWSWLIHVAKKSWIDKESVKDLNTAFFFCQDYFKKNKPLNLPYVSTAQTLNIQKQILEIQEEMAKSVNINQNGIVETDLQHMLKYRELMSNIKFLE
jgi:hypothetical protein